MNYVFWAGIIIGAILSAILSLFINYYTPSFSRFMDSSKASLVERSKRRALARYAEVASLHSGAKDKYFFIINRWGSVLISLIIASMITIIGFVTLVGLHDISLTNGIFLFGLVFAARAMMIIFKIGVIQWRVDNFERYKADLSKRFGRID